MTSTSDNPYAAPTEVDDLELVNDRASNGTWRRPRHPGKVACFWILGWTAFHAVGTLRVSGVEAAMGGAAGFAISVFFAIGLYFGVEMLRRLTLFASVMWMIAFSVGSVMFLIISATNGLGFNGPELTFSSLSLFGTTVFVRPIYAAGILAFLTIAPGYLVAVLWGRRCNGKPIGPGIFSSAKNGVNSRESHHGKQS